MGSSDEFLAGAKVFLNPSLIYSYSRGNKMESTKIDKSLVGEALVGEGDEVAHIDLIIGPKGGAVDYAFMSSLAMPRAGHTPLLAVLDRIFSQNPPR